MALREALGEVPECIFVEFGAWRVARIRAQLGQGDVRQWQRALLLLDWCLARAGLPAMFRGEPGAAWALL
eukprot:768996-Lingulodinium_polyedra.AAC.1